MLDSFRHTDSSSDPSKSLSSKVLAKNPTPNSNTRTGIAATCVAFGGKSRYLCIGDQQGDVCLWDLKKQSRVRQFKSKTRDRPCVQACLDPTATYVCSLTADAFTLYHLRQATFAKQWKFSGGDNGTIGGNNSGHKNMFRFSPLTPSLMAFGDSHGRIQLHDGMDQEQPKLVCGGGYTTHASTTTSLLKHHASPVTGLAFSTQNSKLLANVRGNGILEFVDTSTGEVIHHQQTGGGSATALAFQGVSCVVGTETGEVQVYDLRKMMQQFGKAVTTYQMPNRQAISSLEFAPIPKASAATTGIRSRSPPSRHPSATGSINLGNGVSFDLQSQCSTTSNTTSYTYTEPPASISHLSSIIPSTTDAKLRAAAAAITNNTPPCPPAAGDGVDRKPPPTDPPVVASAAGSVNSASSNSQTASGRALAPTNNAGSISSRLEKITSSSRLVNHHTIQSTNSSASAPVGPTAAPMSPTKVRDINSVSSGSSQHHQRSYSAPTNSAPTSPTLTAPTTPTHTSKGPSPEVTAYLQNMVRQELQHHVCGLREDLDGSIRNVHVDMIRQFHRQSKELTSVILKQQEQIDQLLQQNEFLRNQNASLLQKQQQQHHPSYLPK